MVITTVINIDLTKVKKSFDIVSGKEIVLTHMLYLENVCGQTRRNGNNQFV